MQGGLTKQRIGSRVVGGIMAMIGAVTAVSIYTFYRVDRVQENVQVANQFYVPVLKHLNLLNGKWQAYQRTFEQSVNFRKWGAQPRYHVESKINLRKMVEANLVELARRAKGRNLAEAGPLRVWIERLADLADREPMVIAEIESALKIKRYPEAAATYSRARQEHLVITQDLAQLSRDVENHLALLQLSTEQELRSSQSVMLLLLGASLLFSLVVLFRLRRWLSPIVEWTRVAQEIALKGIHRDVKFPQIRSGMPPEISLLTREFTRMGTTVLERERTIHQQKQKLETLNGHLKEQNGMLRKLGGLNERILNSMSSGLLVISADGLIEQFNERYCELFNADRTAILGKHAAEILAEWPPELVQEWLQAVEPLHRARLSLGRRVFDARVQLLNADAGRLLMFEDVSDLVAAEEKLEHARKLVLAGNLSSQVAHEVRNPLNSMSLQLEMLQEDVTEEQCKKRVAAIAEQVDRLDRITRRYLDVGRTQSTRKEPVNLNEVIEKCIQFLNQEIQVARVAVELQLTAVVCLVGGDADALAQIFFNIVRNSLEAMRENQGVSRRLFLSTVIEGRFVRCQVSDTGSGIAPELASRLFEPFVTNRASGHGLGLSVSRQICIEHGGEMKMVASEVGATFEFSIPLLVNVDLNGPEQLL